MASNNHIVVIGAGVIGLQSALSLRNAGYDVTIIAKHVPGETGSDYTSPWAGGQWRSHASGDDKQEQQWDLTTLEAWRELIKQESNSGRGESLGLFTVESIEYSSISSNPWYYPQVEGFTELTTSELPSNYTHGCKYTSITIDVPVYLDYLFESTIQNDIVTIHEALPTSSFQDALNQAQKLVAHRFTGTSKEHVAAFVNATGISAKSLVPDDNVYPIRGQTVVVNGASKNLTTAHFKTEELGPADPQIIYIIPRAASQSTVLGGTMQEGNWSSSPDPETTRKIIENAKQFAPELLNEEGDFTVLDVKVGLRPGRKGGPRIEIEKLGEFTICHAYGNAGGGYQNSIGFAETVVKLVHDELKAQNST